MPHRFPKNANKYAYADSFRLSGRSSTSLWRPSTIFGDDVFAALLLVGQLVHHVQHDLFAYGPQGTGAGVALQGALGDQVPAALGRELQLAASEPEDLLILLDRSRSSAR